MEPKNIFEFFFSLENPAIYGFLIVMLLLIILILIRKEFIQPLTKKKKQLEIENTNLMALFAEIDPDPILRVNVEGEIISANNTALNDFKGLNLIGSNFNKFFPDFDLERNDYTNAEVIKFNDRFFNISVRKIESLGFKQIYLHDISKRIEYEDQINQYQQSLKNLRTKLENYNESEKQRLGKELHDGIGQNLSIMKIEIQKYIDSNDSSANNSMLTNIISQIDDLSNDIREISHELRPRILHEFGLYPALSSLIDNVNRNSEMKGFLSSNNLDFKFSEEFELNLFRICQESINNIVKHSKCSEFFIQFLQSDDLLRIIISDDGLGFDVNHYQKNGSSSLGILNIKERAANYNGELNIESAPNEGTTIFINFSQKSTMELI